MTIYNLGSINIDMFYRVPHLPAPGETLAARKYTRGLGGKGANMSVAGRRAGSRVCHIGAIGPDGNWTVKRLQEYGVDTTHILETNGSTGHAIINVDAKGENAIILWAGANSEISKNQIQQALLQAGTGDILLMQNETNGQIEAAKEAKERGLKVCYAAAPFQLEAVMPLLSFIDFLVLNEIEAQQLQDGLKKPLHQLPVGHIVVTLGAKGCRWYNNSKGTVLNFNAPKVDVCDTTGAGDTFTGYLIAGLDQGMEMEEALTQATHAGALMVMRDGTADVIPTREEIQNANILFASDHPEK